MWDEGLFSCTPSEEGWEWTRRMSWGTNSAVSALELLGDTLFCGVSWAGGGNNYTYRSIDDGKTWIQAGSGLKLGGALDLWSFQGLLFASSDLVSSCRVTVVTHGVFGVRDCPATHFPHTLGGFDGFF